MDVKGRRMIEGDFRPEARLSQHRKDVDLILAMAERVGARTPFSALHRELLGELESEGSGGEDNSAIIRAFMRE
jgi:3-hydroxyisobutyrate dehydrogenase